MRNRWLYFWVALGIGLVVRTGIRNRGVITDHLEFGRRLIAGEPLYAPFDGPGTLHSVYPPSFGLLTWPFTLVTERVARFGWGALQVASLFVILWCVTVWLRRSRPPRDALASSAGIMTHRENLIWLFAVALGLRYVLRDSHGGGGNMINTALAVGAITIAAAGRHGWAGVLLGISLATKPTTALFVPLAWVLGLRRTAAVSLGIAASALGLAYLIHGDFQGHDLRRWLDGAFRYTTRANVFAPPDYGFPEFSWMNQSLRCAVARYAGSVPAEVAAEVPGFFQPLGLGVEATAAIWRALGLALLTVTGFVAWRRRTAAGARLPLIAATLCVSLLISPISWKAHHASLLPAFALLGVGALEHGRRSYWIGAGIYLFACVLGGGDLVGADFKNLQQSLYLATFGTIGLWVMCLVEASRARPEEPPPDAMAGGPPS